MRRLQDKARSGGPKVAFAAELLGRIEKRPDSEEQRERVARAITRRLEGPRSARGAREFWPVFAALALLLISVTIAGATVAHGIARWRAEARDGAAPSSMAPDCRLRPAAPRVTSGPATPAMPSAPAPDHVSSPDPGRRTQPGTLPSRTANVTADDESRWQLPPTTPSGDGSRDSAAAASHPSPGPVAATALPTSSGTGSQLSTTSGGPPVAAPSIDPVRTPAPAGQPGSDTAPGFTEVPPQQPAHANAAPVRLVTISPPGRAAAPREEAAMVDAAIDALRHRGDAPRATRLLDDYLAFFPNGTLADEALALSIEAAAGRDPGRARVLARSYLRRFPDGQYAAAVRQFLEPSAAR